MTNQDKASINEKDWRKLCKAVSEEPDAQRLSELVEELLRELDRRDEGEKKEGKSASNTRVSEGGLSAEE